MAAQARTRNGDPGVLIPHCCVNPPGKLLLTQFHFTPTTKATEDTLPGAAIEAHHIATAHAQHRRMPPTRAPSVYAPASICCEHQVVNGIAPAFRLNLHDVLGFP